MAIDFLLFKWNKRLAYLICRKAVNDLCSIGFFIYFNIHVQIDRNTMIGSIQPNSYVAEERKFGQIALYSVPKGSFAMFVA